jgi:formylglycine-generating enzyme required for sulfatase activity
VNDYYPLHDESYAGNAATITSHSQNGYVWIPPGEFWMGAVPDDTEALSDEKPRHRVRLTKGFWLAEIPVTVAAYKEFANSSGKPWLWLSPSPAFNPKWKNEEHPIVNVSPSEANAYCEWAGCRLPTEAEWEYAARAGLDGLKYPWGNEICPTNANFAGSKWRGTSPVRSYPPNAWGLYDMAGNVYEWVADWYTEDYYQKLPLDKVADDPTGPDRGTVLQGMRGGSLRSDPGYLRASSRSGYIGIDIIIGFRCVRDSVD